MASFCIVPSGDSPHDRFLAMLPKIREKIAFEFRTISGEEFEEIMAECTANAWFAFRRLVQLGKELLAYPQPLALFAARHYRTGRRVTGDLAREVMSPLCERRHGVTRERFNEREWEDYSAEHCRTTPADIAAFRIDFATWLDSLSAFHRSVAELLASGETTTEVAKRLGVSLSRVSQLRRKLELNWEAFQPETV